MAANGSIEDRLWSKVDKTLDCWEFLGYKCKLGYGRISFRGNSHWLTHRVSWVLHNGEIPDGLNVLHKCDNPSCVNPGHLFLGTHKDNMRDRDKKGRGQLPAISGSKHWNSKLDEGDVRLMRELSDIGCTQKSLAWLFDINNGSVSEIINRKAWKRV